MSSNKIVRRVVHAITYNLYVKAKIRKIDRTSIAGFQLSIPPTVFHPKLYRSSSFFASFLTGLDFRGRNVLDIGCGSGILSLVAASRGAKVTSLDINPEAVRATMKNAELNRLTANIQAAQSNLFSSLPTGQKFDCIIVNPPYYRGEPDGTLDKAWKGGKNHEFFRDFSDGASSVLTADGEIFMILSSDSNLKEIFAILGEHGFQPKLLRSKKMLFELLTIYSFSNNLTNK